MDLLMTKKLLCVPDETSKLHSKFKNVLAKPCWAHSLFQILKCRLRAWVLQQRVYPACYPY